MLALAFMDQTVAGILTLVGIVLFVVAAVLVPRAYPHWPALVAFGLALVWFPIMWDHFAAS